MNDQLKRIFNNQQYKAWSLGNGLLTAQAGRFNYVMLRYRRPTGTIAWTMKLVNNIHHHIMRDHDDHQEEISEIFKFCPYIAADNPLPQQSIASPADVKNFASKSESILSNSPSIFEHENFMSLIRNPSSISENDQDEQVIIQTSSLLAQSLSPPSIDVIFQKQSNKIDKMPPLMERIAAEIPNSQSTSNLVTIFMGSKQLSISYEDLASLANLPPPVGAKELLGSSQEDENLLLSVVQEDEDRHVVKLNQKEDIISLKQLDSKPVTEPPPPIDTSFSKTLPPIPLQTIASIPSAQVTVQASITPATPNQVVVLQSGANTVAPQSPKPEKQKNFSFSFLNRTSSDPKLLPQSPQQQQPVQVQPQPQHQQTAMHPNFPYLFLRSWPFLAMEGPQGLNINDQLTRALNLLDLIPSYETTKVGLIYVSEGQTKEEQYLQNTHGSPHYFQFLRQLGDFVALCEQKNKYTGGLDVSEALTDGEYALLYKDEVSHMVFHVATLMPNTRMDTQLNNKKKHIGNDYVTIVYSDYERPFDMNSLSVCDDSIQHQ